MRKVDQNGPETSRKVLAKRKIQTPDDLGLDTHHVWLAMTNQHHSNHKCTIPSMEPIKGDYNCDKLAPKRAPFLTRESERLQVTTNTSKPSRKEIPSMPSTAMIHLLTIS